MNADSVMEFNVGRQRQERMNSMASGVRAMLRLS